MKQMHTWYCVLRQTLLLVCDKSIWKIVYDEYACILIVEALQKWNIHLHESSSIIV